MTENLVENYSDVANEVEAGQRYFLAVHQGDKKKAKEIHDKDRALFVENLGKLLAQTAEDVLKCTFDCEQDVVEVHFASGYIRRVNVAANSYAAIIRDVCRNL